jgi:hypothetical protein
LRLHVAFSAPEFVKCALTEKAWPNLVRALLRYAQVGLTTASGVQLLLGRFPGLSLQVSWDDNDHWRAYTINAGIAASGQLAEVAPNVVLCVYGSWTALPHGDPGHLHSQRVHVHPTAEGGIEPLV